MSSNINNSDISAGFLDEEILIPIYQKYLETYYRCQNKESPYLNLMGIIFHEAMYYTSSAVYKKFWYEDNNEKIHYPFLGYRPNKFSSIDKCRNKSLKRELSSALSNISYRKNFTVGILNPSAINLPKLIILLLKNRIKFSFPIHSYLFLSDFERQLNLIEKTIKDIWLKYNFHHSYNLLISGVETFYSKITKNKNLIDSYDCLVVGSPVKIPVRAQSAYALSQNIPTICVDHGNETGPAALPSWGYDELSFCTHFMGYGKKGESAIKNENYLKPLHKKDVKYVKSNCPIIKENFSKKPINPLGDNFIQNRGAYLPDKLMGPNRLGPFLSISDKNYIGWQRKLFKAIPSLYYKKHPKQTLNTSLENVKTINTSLEECFDKFDYFVIDYALSTAFTIIAATEKPIIYFNIGWGNFTSLSKESIRDRVIWIDIDINDPGNIMKKIHINNKICKNTYTEQYSITKSNKTREETLCELIMGFAG